MIQVPYKPDPRLAKKPKNTVLQNGWNPDRFNMKQQTQSCFKKSFPTSSCGTVLISPILVLDEDFQLIAQTVFIKIIVQ